jgi:hypothetical protein
VTEAHRLSSAKVQNARSFTYTRNTRLWYSVEAQLKSRKTEIIGEPFRNEHSHPPQRGRLQLCTNYLVLFIVIQMHATACPKTYRYVHS